MIHPTAIVSDKAVIGAGVGIGPYTIVHPHVHLGDNSFVGSHCELGLPTQLAGSAELHIGENATIRSHSIFYAGSTFGPNLTTGHRVTVRENTAAGASFQLGTLGDVQGHCTIGDHVRTQSKVYIAHKSSIGNYVWLFPGAVLTNDPHPPSNTLMGCTLEDFAVIATNAVVLPGVRIGRGAFVGAMTVASRDVPDDTICVGSPGKNIGPTSKIKLTGTDEPAYPWRKHFHRGYPKEAVEAWLREFDGGQEGDG